MPREYIHGREALPREAADDATPAWEEGLVSVGWSAEAEHVQVATLSRDPFSKESLNEGYYVTLDRRGINQLIRQLRRARDQAYGRDE